MAEFGRSESIEKSDCMHVLLAHNKCDCKKYVILVFVNITIHIIILSQTPQYVGQATFVFGYVQFGSSLEHHSLSLHTPLTSTRQLMI